MLILSQSLPIPFAKRRAAMFSFFRRLLFSAVIVWIGIGMPSSAGSYILQGPHILELMVRTLSGAQTLRVEQEVTLYDHSIADHPLQMRETLRYAFPNRFRSDALFENSRRIHVASHDSAITIVDERRIKDHAAVDRYKDVLLYRNRRQLHLILSSYGVDVEKNSLGRLDERIVYVLGAGYPDESVSQLWVDKESFLPLRWLNVFSADPEDRLEFLYRDWRKKGELWYPAVIESYRNKQLIRRIRATEIEVDAALPADLFDISLLTKLYPPEEPSASSVRSSESVDEVQRTIDQFQKKFNDE